MSQTVPTMMTAAARMPKAIQPHWVLSLEVSLFFAAAAPAAATAPGLTEVVAVEVAGGSVAVCVTVAVSVTVTVAAGALVTVSGGRAGLVAVVAGGFGCVVSAAVGSVVVVGVIAVGVVVVGVVAVGVVRVGAVRVGAVRVAVRDVGRATVPPPPPPHAARESPRTKHESTPVARIAARPRRLTERPVTSERSGTAANGL
jgi:hypothetical protein